MREHDLAPLPPDIASLLDAEKLRSPEPAERADRILSRVSASVAAGALGGGAGGGGGQSSTGGGASPRGLDAKWWGSTLAKFLAGAIAGAVTHAGLSQPLSREAPVVSAPVQQPTATARASADEGIVVPSVSLSALPLASAPPLPSTRATGTVRAAPPTLAASSGSGDSREGRDVDLEKERAQIDMARTALARGNTASAIDALQQHERAFPRGRLREERDVMLIQVLMSKGQRAEAERRAATFRRQFPNSMLLPAVAAAVSSTPPAVPETEP